MIDKHTQTVYNIIKLKARLYDLITEKEAG